MNSITTTPQVESELVSKKRLGGRAGNVVVTGFVLSSVAFIMFLTINGASGVPAAVSLLTILLVAFGLIGTAVGMLLLGVKRSFLSRARRGFVLQGIGLVSLFFGTILAVASSSLEFFLGSAVIIAASATVSLLGANLLRTHSMKTHSVLFKGGNLFMLGMLLLFSGAALIIASNIFGATFYLSNAGALIYEDVGATVSAYGCIIGSYSFLRNTRA